MHVATSSVGLVLVKNGQSGIFHKLFVELLELLERVLVVLTGTLRQDVHAEVRISNLLLVVLLVWRTESVSLSLKFLLDYKKGSSAVTEIIKFKFKSGGCPNEITYVSLLEILLFLVETALDDGSASE